ncbi:MAG TPA: methyl-accepting chemotaxis protein [Longimicrobiales bacterium]|nr:methyl-accepting chemotaxis protein [Longimicrobiales bacterium]
MRQFLEYLDRIQGRLILALGALLVGAFIIWVVGNTTMTRFADHIRERIEVLHRSGDLSSRLTAAVLDPIAVGEHYLVDARPGVAQEFKSLGFQAHRLREEFTELAGLSPGQQVQLARISELHESLEVQYSLAHALHDVGRRDSAVASLAGVQPLVRELKERIRVLSSAQAADVAQAASVVQAQAVRGQFIMLMVLLVTIAVGIALTLATIKAINRPLSRLVVAANRMGEGDLGVNVSGRMPAELRVLGGAFTTMSERLRMIVKETIGTAQQIGSSAADLSTISQEVAASSGEVSSAMEEISSGAEAQAAGLRVVDEELATIRERSAHVNRTSARVRELSTRIHELSTSRRASIGEAIQVLLQVREVVRTSGEEVNQLERSSDRIENFVDTIQGIAQQTNLLALNAAIEAARAGDQGRGFAVVAEEVRKLADRSAREAEEVAEAVKEIRRQIGSVVITMETGTAKVAGVEEVSKSAESAFEEIITSVVEVSEAAERVVQFAEENGERVATLVETLRQVSATAESHAASAEQVTAATQQQSAATEEMSAASGELLKAADRLRGLVSGFTVEQEPGRAE